ncbi:MAG: helix-hairpin-helix domain-containing protein [Clostridiales bacterium]|nr:helix-hairpin-helix domain-containing protein [Clostridiales bacterium]
MNINISSIKAYILENKGKSMKAAAVALVLIIALTILLSGSLKKADDIIIIESSAAEQTADDEAAALATEEKEAFIVVDIEGAVMAPGIVRLQEGSRVNDAVLEAGGLAASADTMEVNLAARLSDGDKVYIPTKQERQGSATAAAGIVTDSISGSPANQGNGMVNINTANSEQLQALNGVGPATAQKIIDYRESIGGFKKIEDLMKVSGIGSKTFEKLKDKIIV